METGDLSHQTAHLLLRIGAVALRPSEPFRFASGLLSPIYCDNRLLISYPRERRAITQGFAQLLRERAIRVSVIAGTATAGIPHAAWLAAELDLPMVYVRSQAKDHGKGRQVEGLLPAGQSIVVVEDLITTGGSALKAVAALRREKPSTMGDEGAPIETIVQHVLAIFGYDFPKTAKAFAQAGVQLHPLTTFPTLLEVAIDKGYISADERSLVAAWASDPASWSQAREKDLAN